MTRPDSSRSVHSMLDNLPGMAYRRRNDSTLSIEYVSPGCKSLTGYVPGDLLKGDFYGSLVHPDDVEGVWDQLQTARTPSIEYEIDYRLVDVRGETKWVRDRGVDRWSPKAARSCAGRGT